MSDDKVAQINRLKSLITNNSSQISSLSNSITNMERAHDSLIQFRRSVVSAQESVNSITHNQNQYLSPVKALSNVNNSAKKYGNGMSNTLSGVGTRIVGYALIGLLLKIDVKLNSYKTSISNANNTINQLQSQSAEHNTAIKRLEKQIKEEQEAKTWVIV